MLPEKGSIRGLVRATGHSTNTIIYWMKVAGAHFKEVNEYYLSDLKLERVQVDEIWSYIKKRTLLIVILNVMAMFTHSPQLRQIPAYS
jgi:uncharacterized protein (DUF433 family)